MQVFVTPQDLGQTPVQCSTYQPLHAQGYIYRSRLQLVICRQEEFSARQIKATSNLQDSAIC